MRLKKLNWIRSITYTEIFETMYQESTLSMWCSKHELATVTDNYQRSQYFSVSLYSVHTLRLISLTSPV